MKNDLQNREDLLMLLKAFYEKAFEDEKIGFFFTQVVPLNLETHIPVIADFWDSVVFGTRGYSRNVMEVHQHISSLSQIRKEHLDRWVELWVKAQTHRTQGANRLEAIEKIHELVEKALLKKKLRIATKPSRSRSKNF